VSGPERDPTHLPRLVLRLASLSALAFSTATLLEYALPTPTFCAAGGGCAAVREWASTPIAGIRLASVLPITGVMAYTTLFVGSLVAQRTAVRVIGALAVLGGVGAAALVALQAASIGAFCWLCVGVDSSALVAAGAGVVLLMRASQADPKAPARLRSPYWTGVVLAVFGPLAFAVMLPDPDVPPPVQRLYRRGAVNVVEMVDFECPYCRALHPVVKAALAEHGGDDVNLVRVIVPLSFHVHARGAAAAYYCADRMGQREPMADRLMAAEDLSRGGLVTEARTLGLDVDDFERCLDEPATEQRVVADERLAEAAQNRGLPTTYIGNRTLLGFDPRNGAAGVREAVQAAREGEGARTRLWPFALVLFGAVLAFVWGRGGDPEGGAAEKPPAKTADAS
jgi:protein-disulfide isomerase/uncharacterized membrane protein